MRGIILFAIICLLLPVGCGSPYTNKNVHDKTASWIKVDTNDPEVVAAAEFTVEQFIRENVMKDRQPRPLYVATINKAQKNPTGSEYFIDMWFTKRESYDYPCRVVVRQNQGGSYKLLYEVFYQHVRIHEKFSK